MLFSSPETPSVTGSFISYTAFKTKVGSQCIYYFVICIFHLTICNEHLSGDSGSIPWVGEILQCFCLENPMTEELGELQSHGVTKSRTQS